MTVIKSLYQNKREEAEYGKSIGGYKHRVHRSKKNRFKDAAWLREMRVARAQAKGKSKKFNKRRILYAV